jgi:hypothetical protein
VSNGGLPAVMSQTFRALISSRMQVGMASYRWRYPEADVLLLEPDRSDEALFFSNVFRYADRRRLANHAYQNTRRDLLHHARALRRVLRRHGMDLRLDVLRDPHRTLSAAARERTAAARALVSRLEQGVQRLESWLRSTPPARSG